MVTSYNKPLMPYDIAFTGEMGRVGEAEKRLAATPTDYSRRGGAAFGRRGEMYTSLYEAAANAAANRRQAEQSREIAWTNAGIRKQALADKIKAEGIASLVGGISGLAQDYARRGAKIGSREMTETDLGPEEFKRLMDSERIKEIMASGAKETGAPVGTGRYQYTPKGAFEEFHRGPYWWETPGSTGGWGK